MTEQEPTRSNSEKNRAERTYTERKYTEAEINDFITEYTYDHYDIDGCTDLDGLVKSMRNAVIRVYDDEK